jgi:hypothetical protein
LLCAEQEFNEFLRPKIRRSTMLIRTLTAAALLAALAFPVSAMADENGAVGGAVAGGIGGALVGGPVGLVVGGVGGAVVGSAVTNHRGYHRYAARHPNYHTAQ